MKPGPKKNTRTCNEEGCDQPVRCRGLCQRHYNLQWARTNRNKRNEANRKADRKTPTKMCEFPGCGNTSRTNSARHCGGHYGQERRGQELRPLWSTRVFDPMVGCKRLCSSESCTEPAHSKGMCKKHYLEQYKRDNRDHLNSLERGYHTERMLNDPKYVETKRERGRRAHHRADPVKVATQNLAWTRANRDKRQESARRRIARRKGAKITEMFTKEEIWGRDGGMCGICFEYADKDNWHLDHIIPLSRGGNHTRDNVQVSHPFCNLSKKDLLLEEFYARREVKANELSRTWAM